MHRIAFLLIVLGVWSSGCGKSAAQSAPQFVATQWTIDDGLPVNSVNAIVQTDDGYMWLGTFDGLVRFDGLDFSVYRSGDYPGLPSSRITDLYTVGEELWLVTESWHLVRLHRGRFEILNDSDGSGNVQTVHQAPDGTPWVGTTTGAFRYVDGNLKPIAPAVLSGASVEALLHSSDGALWVGTRNDGLYRRDTDGQWHHWTSDGPLASNTVFDLVEDPVGTVWVGTFPYVQQWSNGAFTSIRHRLTSAGHVHGFAPNDEDAPWLATDRGMFRMTKGTFDRIDAYGPVIRAQNYFVAAPDPTGARSGYVNTGAFHEDDAGNLWLGTDGDGLYRLKRSPIHVVGVPEGLSSDNVYPIAQRQDGSLWVGTLGGGLNHLRGDGVDTYVLERDGRPFTNVWALHEGRSGTFWVGGPTLCAFVDGRCARADTESVIGETRIRAIYEDRAGRLWLGTEDGLYLRPDATDPTAPWTRFTPQNSGLSHSFVRVIRETSDGSLWFGTNGGGIVHYADGHFNALTEADGLPSNLVREIYRDSTGVFWIGTEDNGLARMTIPPHEPDSASVAAALDAADITPIGTEDGLFDDVIHRIIEADGRLWMSTNRGLFRVEKSELTAFARGHRSKVYSVSYTTRSGLRSREANGGVQPAGIRARDGRIWFPTQAGAAVIDPSTVHRGTGAPPPARIEHVTVDGRRFRPDTVETLTVAPGVEEIAVDYTALEYSDPRNVQFRYQLHGLHASWTNADTRRTAYFTNLAPGSYRLSVAARSAATSWSSPATLSFTVQPHFYQTTAFYVLCLILFGLGAYGFVRYRIRAHRNRAEELDRLVDERTRQLQEERQALQQSEARFRAVFEGAAPGIAVLDPDRRVLAVNPALQSMLDVDPPAASDAPRFDALLAADTSFDDAQAFQEVLEGHRASVLREYRFAQPDGTELWGQTSVSRLPPQGERGPRLLVFVVDVTRRKQLEARLRQSQRLETVGTLTGGIAHEFNNVLHTARGYLEMGLDNPDASSWTFVERAGSNLERASELVEQLLTFTQQEAKASDERVDVGSVVRDAVDLTRPALPDNVTARVDTEDGAIVRGDGSKIQQVAVNLVTNAGQAMAGQADPAVLDVFMTTVAIDSDLAALHVDLDPGRYACLTVSDTGPGMNEEMQKTIFDPFFSTKDVGKGTGLGLAVVHGIVSAHDGTVVVHSREGHGTSFVVYLPMDDDATDPAQAPAPPEPAATGSHGTPRRRVLLVDSNAPRRTSDCSRLRRLGCAVTACGDAAAARSALADAPSGAIDLVITGFDLPDTDGLAFTRSLRRDGYDGPIVIASVYGAHVTDENARAAGADAFLHRPMGPRDWNPLVRTLSRREEA
jgi:PAS domain S-box-containing protein